MAFLKIDLTLFGEDSGAPTGDGQVAAADPGVSADGGEQVAAARDYEAEFDGLIKGEYKKQYNDRVKRTVEARLKSTNETVAKYEQLTPLIQMLQDRYHTADGDIEALLKAAEDDESYYEAEALEKGVTVEHLKASKKMQRENAALRAELEKQRQQQSVDAIYSKWMEQAEEAKQIYPSLVLEDEIKNEKFARLLRSGIDVETAYSVVHRNEIIPAAMQHAVKSTTEKIAASIASGASRPVEGGKSASSGAVINQSVYGSTRAQREEWARRAAKGERITFK